MEEASWLGKLFEESEVLEVVKGMYSDKASGLYGFPMAFLQACWDVIKADIMGAFHDFFMLVVSLKKTLMPL